MPISRKSPKGIALPMETIIIIAIVVLVLVVIVALFVRSSGAQIKTIAAQEALATGCTDLVVRYGCDANEIPNVNIARYEGGLEKACKDNGYGDDYEKCARMACRCA